MLTKGIIERIEDSYSYRVRIPIINKIKGASTGTDMEELSVACVSCSPGCKISYQPNDVVIIGFEENKSAKPVILGQLYRENELTDSQTVLNTTIIAADVQAQLPADTTIGSVEPEALQNVSGARDNLQRQIDLLNERLSFFDNIPRLAGTYKLKVTVNSTTGCPTYEWVL